MISSYFTAKTIPWANSPWGIPGQTRNTEKDFVQGRRKETQGGRRKKAPRGSRKRTSTSKPVSKLQSNIILWQGNLIEYKQNTIKYNSLEMCTIIKCIYL